MLISPVTKDYETVLLLSGGGWKGAFQLDIIKYLMNEYYFDLILGTSVGAINGIMAAQDKLDVLEQYWALLNDRFSLNGVNGFLKPAAWKCKGLYSLDPLMQFIKKEVSLTKLKTDFGCGITLRETKKYINQTYMPSISNTQDHHLHAAIHASSAIAGLMEPAKIFHNGKQYTGSDGGHMHACPIPFGFKPKRIIAVVNYPLEPQPQETSEIDYLLDSFLWAFDMQMQIAHKHDLLTLEEFKEAGSEVIIYAPEKDLGGTLDAKKETLLYRREEGRKALARPVIL